MLIKELINSEFIPLVPDDTVSAAIAKMDAWQASSIPVIEPATKKVVGNIRFNDLAGTEDKNTLLSDVIWQSPIFSYRTQHVFEAAKKMLQHKIRLLSVVDENEEILGVIEKKHVLEALSEMLNLTSEGAVVSVFMQNSDFTLSRLVHLVESEGAKILGLAVENENSADPESHLKISIKLNNEDTTTVISSLTRHGYVTTSVTRDDYLEENLANRADELLKYLEL